MPRVYLSLDERFWTKVNKNGPIPTNRPDLGPCWVWTGLTNDKGYGQLKGPQSKDVGAHRVSFFLEHGHWPLKGQACHHCDNPPCVRPSHLFDGTQSDNMRDAMNKGRMVIPSQKGLVGPGRGEAAPNAKLTDEAVRYILSSSSPGTVLALELGVSENGISRVRKRQSWKHLQCVPATPTIEKEGLRGEMNGKAKLTDDDVRFIRSSSLAGVELAKMLGVAKSLISRVRLRKTRQHVI